MKRAFAFIACAFMIAAGCLPRGDLDGAARGSGDESTGVEPVADATSAGDGSSSGASHLQAGQAGKGGQAGQAGSSSGQQAMTSAGSSGSGAGVSGGSNSAAPIMQQDLPIFLADSPLVGEVSIVGDALWEVNGALEPTFEIRTPAANYWLVKSLGALVSLTDTAATDSRQWIGYSSFRPSRGVPSYASVGLSPTFSTAIDAETQTPAHVRLRSETTTADLTLVWDFYLTHVTVSVEVAPAAFEFSYRGVPAGGLDSQDSLLTADGAAREAFTFWSTADFPGKPEWVAITDPGLGRALFLIQHYDDGVPDRYQVKDNDSAFASFGRTQTSYSARYSMGLLESAEFSSIESRVAFVDTAMR